MRKFARQKFPTLSAAAVDDEDDLPEEEHEELEESDDDDLDEDTLDDEDDESSEEDDEPSEDDEDEPAPKKSSRAQDRIRALNAQRRETERQNIELRQRLEAIQAQTLQQNTQADQQAQQAFYNSLTPQDKLRYDLNTGLRAQQAEMQRMQFNMQDQTDKAAYDSKALVNPTYAKYAAEVERALSNLRAQNRLNAPREEILKHILGEKLLANKAKGITKKDAKKSVNKNTVKSSGAGKKSDISGGNRKGKTPRERLEGVRF